MHLSAIGKFAQDQIHHTAAIRDGDVSIPQYTVMPNHIHMMVVIHRRRDALNASLEPNAECTRMDAQTMDARGTDERKCRRTRCVHATIFTQRRRFGPQTGICRQKNGGARWWHPPETFNISFPNINFII